MTIRILIGDVRERLADLADESVNCVVTSPPYYGLRDYGVAGQIGLEETPDAYIAELVKVFRECRRVLKNDGTLWLNLGDSYATNGVKQTGRQDQGGACTSSKLGPQRNGLPGNARIDGAAIRIESSLKPKDLLMIPARVALALQADGWWLRSEIIWAKPNPMPESVTDRPTSSHEKIYLLAKAERYYFDADAVAEAAICIGDERHLRTDRTKEFARPDNGSRERTGQPQADTRNIRNVWTIATQPYSEAHFATFPPALIEPCIKAGCPKGGTVLDPFGGAGTTGLVADRLERNAVLIELNPEYAAMATARIKGDAPLFADVA